MTDSKDPHGEWQSNQALGGVTAGAALPPLHPAVVASYICAVVVLTAASMQPVLAAISCVGAILSAATLMGARRSSSQLRWQLPALVIVTLVNPLYSHSGATTLLVLGPVVIRAEALVFGFTMGLMMIATIMWLECASYLLGFDQLLELGGGLLPATSLIVSMALELTPRLIRRSREVTQVRTACTAASVSSNQESPLTRGARLSGVLMDWAMEGSLGRADAMRARGWRSGASRTSYRRERFAARDGVAEICLMLLVALCALVAYAACSSWSFYPLMPRLVWCWWGYAPYAVLMVLPALATLIEWMRWQRWEAA